MKNKEVEGYSTYYWPVVKKGNKKESTYIKCWSNKKQKAEGGINQKIPMLLFS
jgi:hypothetical protein